MLARSSLIALLVGMVSFFGLLGPASAGSMTVGPYLVNSEGVFNASAQRYSLPLNLGVQTRLVVQVAAQYAIDFGIIPAADLKKWRAGQPARFLFRLSGDTDTRYITLKAGSYYVVAQDLNGGVVANGFAMKVRRFTGKANDNGVTRFFVRSQKASFSIFPNNWDGSVFQMPVSGKLWLDGTFSRGADRRVKWEIVTEAEYKKVLSGLPHKALLTGTNPKTLGFHFVANPARYYFLLFNESLSYSAFTVTWEQYR